MCEICNIQISSTEQQDLILRRCPCRKRIPTSVKLGKNSTAATALLTSTSKTAALEGLR